MAEPVTVSGDGASYEPYGQRSTADDTRQAQHMEANDAPVDVNLNAVFAREQAGTMTLMGKNFEASAMRFNGLMGQKAAETKST